MNRKERIRATEECLIKLGHDATDAKEFAKIAVDDGEPLLESLCFERLAVHLLATIHTSSWIEARAKQPDSDGDKVIQRLVDSGASASGPGPPRE